MRATGKVKGKVELQELKQYEIYLDSRCIGFLADDSEMILLHCDVPEETKEKILKLARQLLGHRYIKGIKGPPAPPKWPELARNSDL